MDFPDKFHYERLCAGRGARFVCGVDEAGRGPLAGPVTAAAVIMDPERIVSGADDSKKLSEGKRERLFDQIVSAAVAFSVVSVDNLAIDRMNILNATKAAMREAVLSLSVPPDAVLVDAVDLDLPYPVLPIIRGDALSYTIGCASILAKVTRDRLMREADVLYPGYGFARNKGYGTAEHIEALRRLGPVSIHRKTFIGHFVKAD